MKKRKNLDFNNFDVIFEFVIKLVIELKNIFWYKIKWAINSRFHDILETSFNISEYKIPYIIQDTSDNISFKNVNFAVFDIDWLEFIWFSIDKACFFAIFNINIKIIKLGRNGAKEKNKTTFIVT